MGKPHAGGVVVATAGGGGLCCLGVGDVGFDAVDAGAMPEGGGRDLGWLAGHGLVSAFCPVGRCLGVNTGVG